LKPVEVRKSRFGRIDGGMKAPNLVRGNHLRNNLNCLRRETDKRRLFSKKAAT